MMAISRIKGRVYLNVIAGADYVIELLDVTDKEISDNLHPTEKYWYREALLHLHWVAMKADDKS